MSAEYFISLALPHSVAGDAESHVTVFVSPKIVPDAQEDRLGNSVVFADWAQALTDSLEITLFDQSGSIDVAVVSTPDPAVWAALFPSETPVRTNAVPYWEEREWRTFSARSAHDIAKAVHMQSIYADPTTPPVPSGHPLLPHVRKLMNAMVVEKDPVRGYDAYEQFDESRVTAQLDRELQVRWSGRGAEDQEWHENHESGLDQQNARVRDTDDFMQRILLELHRARRFYERPESATTPEDYQERPSEQSRRVDSKQPEFHEIIALTADSRELQRALGLAIDVRAHDPARLAQATTLWAHVAVRGRREWNRPLRVATRALADDSFVTVARGADWIDGAVALGDERLFSVLDLDADGSALKTERYLWSMQRLEKIEKNDDPVSAATPAMRAVGFTVARTDDAIDSQDQLYRQVVTDNRLAAASAGVDEDTFAASEPELATEDVTRGMHVEVWDDVTRTWASLHSCTTEIEIDGFGLLKGADGGTTLPTEGYVQGTAATQTPNVATAPVHVHEAAFGWDGWSLSAPRPGKRVRNVPSDTETTEAGLPRVQEQAEDPQIGLVTGESKTHPVRVSHVVAPGTLPRLRFGRSYAFRAWAVDLAGNMRPHGLAASDPVGPDALAEFAPLLEDGHLLGAVAVREHTRSEHIDSVVAGLKRASVTRFTEQADVDRSTLIGRFAVFASSNVPAEAADEILGRLRRLRGGLLDQVVPAGLLTRSAVVNAAVQAAVAREDQTFLRDTVTADRATLAALLASLFERRDIPRLDVGDLLRALRSITLPKPYLRWDPVPSPAVVPRRPYTDGESLRVLVVRSGVTQDPNTLELSIVDPVAYADIANAAKPVSGEHAVDASDGKFYWPESERHLAPAKTSQVQAEQHDAFGPAIGAGTPAALRAALAQALREDGSFFNLTVADLNTPGARLPTYAPDASAVMRLVSQPGPQRAPRMSLAELDAAPGDAPPPGYYVIHDVDALQLPYLPDPLAHGIAIVFPEAGADRAFAFPFGVEGFTAAFGGSWPEVEPFRLRLRDGADLTASVTGRDLDFTLPAGDSQTFLLSSSLRRDRLDHFGVWRTMPAAASDDPDVAEAAADGLLWGLTPGERFLLVHAVPRPLGIPAPTRLFAWRNSDETVATVYGGLDVHGQSTDSVTAHARWIDQVDDVSRPGPHEAPSNGIAFTTPVLSFEEVAVLGSAEQDVHVPGFGRLHIHLARHQFTDTKHRTVTYRFRASTRFREYFPAELLSAEALAVDGVGNPIDDPAQVDDGRSVVGPAVLVSVPSSALPAAPIVHSVLPLFRWSNGAEPEQPLAFRHHRQSGVRIYLERPWYSSGEGELLGVLLAPGGNDEVPPLPPDGTGFPYVSQWGRDPLWLSPSVAKRALATLQLDSLLPSAGPVEDIPGRPVAGPVTHTLPATPGSVSTPVVVLGYKPQFNPERRLWYVDVAMDAGTAFWPFVRLAVARYQPQSVTGKHLSTPVRCDFVQLPPERTVSVSRTDDEHVRVVVVGPAGVRQAPIRVVGRATARFAEIIRQNRLIVARLQRADPAVPGDLGWKTVATTELLPRGVGDIEGEIAWTGEVGASEAIPLLRPGGSSEWRVTVEEWERFPGDPPARADVQTEGAGPVWEQRLVFADEFPL